MPDNKKRTPGGTKSSPNNIRIDDHHCHPTLSNPKCFPCLHDHFRDIGKMMDWFNGMIQEEMVLFARTLGQFYSNSLGLDELPNLDFREPKNCPAIQSGIKCHHELCKDKNCLKCLFTSVDETFAGYMQDMLIRRDQIEVYIETFEGLIMNTMPETCPMKMSVEGEKQ